MTDRTGSVRERAIYLAACAYPDTVSDRISAELISELRAAFEAGYLACVAEDDEPQGDDVVLRCYHPSGTWDLVSLERTGNKCCWRISSKPERVGWPEVLARGYVRRVRLIEEGSGS